MARRRCVARVAPGGSRIWDNRARCWWGELYELCPDALLQELNGRADPRCITELLRQARTR